MVGRNSFLEVYMCDEECQKYTPNNILKVGCLEHSAFAPAWVAWSKCVEKKGDIGNYETPFTAAWIIKEGCINHNDIMDTNSILEWAEFAYRYPMYSAAGDYIDATFILQMASKNYSIFRNKEWSGLRDLKEKIGYIEE